MTPTDCLFHENHLWLRRGDEDEAWVGITHHAQNQLGEIVYVETPEVGAEIRQGASLGIVESVKVMSDLISPISGTVLAVNSAAIDDPSHINREPYGEGWLVKVRISNIGELENLVDAESYRRLVGGSAVPRDHDDK